MKTAPAEGSAAAGPPRSAALAVSLLIAFLVAQAFLWPRAAWLFIPARDRPAVERALAAAAASFADTTAEDIRWRTRPRVARFAGRTCITLAAAPRPVFGYRACYDDRTGEAVDELAWT